MLRSESDHLPMLPLNKRAAPTSNNDLRREQSSQMSQHTSEHSTFRAAAKKGPRRFFDNVERKKRAQLEKAALKNVLPHDVPILVLPSKYEQEKQVRSARPQLLTSAAKGGIDLPQIPLTDRPSKRTRRIPCPPALPLPTSSRSNSPSTSALPQIAGKQQKQQPTATVEEYRRRRKFTFDYDGDDEAIRQRDDENVIDSFEESLQSKSCEGHAVVRAVTTVDEEASARVLKVMFQLSVTTNSAILTRLKEIDANTLQKRVVHEIGHKKQMSREEFFILLQKVLRDEHINRRDSNTLFSVFDDDKSGLVDAGEFINGFTSLVSAGTDDVAFKFLAMLFEGREKSTMNAFLSRFELQVLITAAQSFYKADPDIVQVLENLPAQFNFSHHMGRIPVIDFRNKIVNDPELLIIFENLPNPLRASKEALNAVGFIHASKKEKDPNYEGSGELWGSGHLVADQFMNPNSHLQASAEEHDSPRWWSTGAAVFRSTKSNPYEELVFLGK